MIAREILFVIVLAALPAMGCNRGGVTGSVPVTGTVTYKGQPVAGATVTFISGGDARTAVAVTDRAGRYQLTTLDSAGAMPGNYAVVVTKTDISLDSDKPISMDEAAQNRGKAIEPKQLLPSKYGDPSKTPLKFEVQPGRKNKFDLQLID